MYTAGHLPIIFAEWAPYAINREVLCTELCMVKLMVLSIGLFLDLKCYMRPTTKKKKRNLLKLDQHSIEERTCYEKFGSCHLVNANDSYCQQNISLILKSHI